MQTPHHDLVIGVVGGFIVLAITKSYGWLSDRLDAWGNKQAAANLKNMESNPVLYADKALRKMRTAFCMAGYFFCFGIAFTLYGTGFRPLGAFFSLIAAVSCGIAGGYSRSSTVEGVNDRIKRTRNRLKLPDAPQSIALGKTAP